MSAIKELLNLLAPAATILFGVALLAIQMQATKTKRLEEELRETNLRILDLTTIIVKYCNAPIEVVMDQVKDQKDYLVNIPQDDLLSQIIDKYTRS